MNTLLKETVANPGRDKRVPLVSLLRSLAGGTRLSRPHRFRGLAGVVCAALAGMALAAERTPDGLGLVDALTGTPVSGDP